MFLFGRNKTPQELVKALRELLTQLERGEKKYDKVSKRFEQLNLKRSFLVKLLFFVLFCFLDCRRCDQVYNRHKKYSLRHERSRATNRSHCSIVTGDLQCESY
jgi:hypothetical protein